MKSVLKILFIFSVIAVSTSTHAMDDQTILTFDREKIANPTPVPRDFARINAQHKILIGIIDTGVDYNQPLLTENIHFQLNSSNIPIGFGFDALGEDMWAAPFIVRTSDYNPDIYVFERTKYAVEADRVRRLINENPEFSIFLNPLRNNGVEIQTVAYHGTHVAGLASYDTPEIGILGYRVLPYNSKMKDGELVAQDSAIVFANQVVAAATHAVQQGARILNLSLEMSVETSYGDPVKSETAVNKQRLQLAKLKDFALANPNVVIAVAAGNSGKWIDQNTRMGFPCGVDAPNIICVGATDDKGQIASFSNLLMTEGAFILGYGVKVKSTMPTSMCASRAVGSLAGNPNVFKTPADKARVVAQIKKDCVNLSLKELNGTSMATPIIARQLAKILLENSGLSGAQAIQTLLSRAATYKMGRVSFPVLRVEKPSWTQEFKLKSHGINLQKASEPDYFDFVLPSVEGAK